MAVAGKTPLLCNACGVADLFIDVFKLSYSPTLGVTKEPTGQYMCQTCHGLVDQELMVEGVKLAEKRADIQRQQEEFHELELAKAQRKAGVPGKEKVVALEKEPV